MRTACLPTVHASVSTRCHHQWGGGCSQVNMSEQVPSLGHQIPPAQGPCTVRSHVWGCQGLGGQCTLRFHVQGGSLFGEVQCIMGNGRITPPPSCTEWLTDTTENITFPEFRWRVVKTGTIHRWGHSMVRSRVTAVTRRWQLAQPINVSQGSWLKSCKLQVISFSTVIHAVYQVQITLTCNFKTFNFNSGKVSCNSLWCIVSLQGCTDFGTGRIAVWKRLRRVSSETEATC